MILKLLKTRDANAERWALLVFYILLVGTMAIEVLRREVSIFIHLGRGNRPLFVYLSRLTCAAVLRTAPISVLTCHVLRQRPDQGTAYIFGDLVAMAVACVALYWHLKR